VTNDVAPFGPAANDRRFGETYCLRLRGKEKESALKLKALGYSKTLAVVPRIHSITRLKTLRNGVYNICLWRST